MITREFKLYLNAGTGIAPVINANQFDEGEEWIFTLLESDGTVYTPSTGSIIGLKSDGTTILDAGTVNAEGQVVITETVQMTASSGKNVYELLLDGDSHGTANFIVFVEPRPGDIEHPSETELSLFEETIQAAGNVQQFQADISALQSGLATTNANLTSEANTRASADATLQSAISTEASTRSTQDAVLQAEIDQIIAPSGEAPSAAEVQNARIGVDGTTYDTLGNAIRGQVGDLKNALDNRVNRVVSSNIFDKTALSVGRLNGNWGNISQWNDFNYSDYIKTDANIIYFSQCPYEVAFYNNGTRVGIYPASQLVADENGWYKTPNFSTVHDGFAFDFPTTQSATYYVNADTMMVGTSNLGSTYIEYANYPTLYGKRAALYSELPSSPIIPDVPDFVEGTTNIFVGKDSGINTTESSSDDNGKYNTGLGVNAMKQNTSGDHCTAVGFQAMQKNTTGNGNTGLGEDALYENQTGTSNVAVGSHTLQNNTKSGNTAVGSSALINQTTGYYNTAIGVEAGRNLGTSVNAITSDDRMTLIGGYANKKVATALTNSTVIGFQAQADKSNQAVIGNEDVTEFVLGSKVLVFNQDGTVSWIERT